MEKKSSASHASFENKLNPSSSNKKVSLPINSFPTINHSSSSINTKSILALSKIQMASNEQAEKNKVQKTGDVKEDRLAINHLSNQLNKCLDVEKQEKRISKTLNFMKKFDTGKFNHSKSLAQFDKIKKQITLSRGKNYEKQQSVYKESSRQKKLGQRNSLKQLNELFGNSIRQYDKKIGHIRGFVVNSQIGTLCPLNNIRVSIGINILKSVNKSREISFFGLFEGRNGCGKADYMKEVFHQSLATDEYVFYNFQKSVKRVFDKIDREFSYDPKFDGDFSSVQLICCVIISSTMYFIRSGKPNATVSDNFGKYIKTFTVPLKKKTSNNIQNSGKYQINVRSFQLDNNFDFFILGSEGLYDVFNTEGQIGRTFWKLCLTEENVSQPDSNIKNKFNYSQYEKTSTKFYQDKKQSEKFNQINSTTLSGKLAKISHQMCWSGIKSDRLGRCGTLIVVAFESLEKCLSNYSKQELHLPFKPQHNVQNQNKNQNKEKVEFKLEKKFSAQFNLLNQQSEDQ